VGRGAGFRRVRRGGAARAAVPLLVAAVVLAYIAASTSKIRLLTTVTVLSLLDPVRVAEDYATLDQCPAGASTSSLARATTRTRTSCFGYDLDGQWEPEPGEVRAPPATIAAGEGQLGGEVPSGVVGGNDPAEAVPDAEHPDLARLASSTESTEPGGEMGRAAVLGERVPPAGEVRRADPALPRTLGGVRPRPGRCDGWSRVHGLYVKKTSQQAIEGYRPIFRCVHGFAGRQAQPVTVQNAGGFPRGWLGAGRLAGTGDRQVRRYQAAFVTNCPASRWRWPGLSETRTAPVSKPSSPR